MRFQMRLVASCINSRESAKLISANPMSMVQGELLFMLANAEGAQLVIQIGHALGAGNIEVHGIGTKYVFIVIDGVVVQQDLVTLLDVLPAQLSILHGGATHGNEGGVVAQDFFTGVADFVRVVYQVLQLFGVFHQ